MCSVVIFREKCKAESLLAEDVEWIQVLAEAFRSFLVPLTHVFALISASSEPTQPWDLWNGHRSMALAELHNPLRRCDLFKSDTDALAYAVLEVKNCFTDTVTFWFFTFRLSKSGENPVPLAVKL